MKKLIVLAVLIVLAGAASAQARVDFSLNIGVPVAVAPAPVVYPAPAAYQAPAVYPAPVVYPAPIAYAEPPNFIFSPALGFYVSVGLPYDVVYIDNCYYQYREGRWYTAASYGGPWSYVTPRALPYGLYRHRYEQIRYYRDREYRTYLGDRDHYRGNWFRPVAVRHDARRDYRDR